jgi:hypothetical protein
VSTNLSSLIPTEVPTLLTRAEITIGECAALPDLRPSRSDSTVAIEERFEQLAAGLPLGEPCGFFYFSVERVCKNGAFSLPAAKFTAVV